MVRTGVRTHQPSRHYPRQITVLLSDGRTVDAGIACRRARRR